MILWVAPMVTCDGLGRSAYRRAGRAGIVAPSGVSVSREIAGDGVRRRRNQYRRPGSVDAGRPDAAGAGRFERRVTQLSRHAAAEREDKDGGQKRTRKPLRGGDEPADIAGRMDVSEPERRKRHDAEVEAI